MDGSLISIAQAPSIVTYHEVRKEFEEQFKGYQTAVRDVAGDSAAIEARRLGLAGKRAVLPSDAQLAAFSLTDDATMTRFLDTLDKASGLYAKLEKAEKTLQPVSSDQPNIQAYKTSIASRNPQLLAQLEDDERTAQKIFDEVRGFLTELNPVAASLENGAKTLRGSIWHFRQDVERIKTPPPKAPPKDASDAKAVASYWSRASSLMPSVFSSAAPVAQPVEVWDAVRWGNTPLPCEEARKKEAELEEHPLEIQVAAAKADDKSASGGVAPGVSLDTNGAPPSSPVSLPDASGPVLASGLPVIAEIAAGGTDKAKEPGVSTVGGTDTYEDEDWEADPDKTDKAGTAMSAFVTDLTQPAAGSVSGSPRTVPARPGTPSKDALVAAGKGDADAKDPSELRVSDKAKIWGGAASTVAVVGGPPGSKTVPAHGKTGAAHSGPRHRHGSALTGAPGAPGAAGGKKKGDV